MAGFVGLLALMAYISPQPPESEKTIAERKAVEIQNAAAQKQVEQNAKRVVDLMLKQGSLQRIDPSQRKAWVDPIIWFALDAQRKEILAQNLAIYSMPAYPEIDIFDAQSARKIASYGPFQGFKVY